MNDHADLDLIAAFREGLLDPATGGQVGRHLARCGECAQRQAALSEVTSWLAQAPMPPVPPQLQRRLDAALDEEIAAARRPAQEVTAGHGRRRPGNRGSAARAGRGWPAAALRPLAAAAAVCLLAGGGYLLLRSVLAGPARTPGAAARSASHPAVSGGALEPRAPAAEPAVPGTGQSVLVVSSGTSYQPGTLRAQAETVLQRYAGRLESPGKAGNTAVQPFGPAAMSGCAARVSGGRQPVLVDRATYRGQPVIVIIAQASGTVPGHVWVVGLGCSASATQAIANSGL